MSEFTPAGRLRRSLTADENQNAGEQCQDRHQWRRENDGRESGDAIKDQPKSENQHADISLNDDSHFILPACRGTRLTAPEYFVGPATALDAQREDTAEAIGQLLSDRATLLFGEQAPLRRPLQLEEKFLNAVRMKEVVQRHMSKHDEDGIVAVLSMCGSPSPDFR
jgi:hypothetical protein